MGAAGMDFLGFNKTTKILFGKQVTFFTQPHAPDSPRSLDTEATKAYFVV
jgi:hypothetical protein